MSYSANAELITEHSKNVKQNRSLRVVRAPGVSMREVVWSQAAQTLWEFFGLWIKRMYENWNKIRPKFHSLTKIEIKITYLVFGEKTDRFCNSTYEHRRASALLRNIRNMDLAFGWEKTYRFCNLRKWKDFNKKNSSPYLKCVLRLSCACGPRADLWPFYGFLRKRFSKPLYQRENRLRKNP